MHAGNQGAKEYEKLKYSKVFKIENSYLKAQ